MTLMPPTSCFRLFFASRMAELGFASSMLKQGVAEKFAAKCPLVLQTTHLAPHFVGSVFQVLVFSGISSTPQSHTCATSNVSHGPKCIMFAKALSPRCGRGHVAMLLLSALETLGGNGVAGELVHKVAAVSAVQRPKT
jgi:hypothetical protein